MADGKKKKKSDYVLLRKNRRKNLRGHLLVLKVKGSSMDKSFFGYARTIGRNGMFIASINPKNVGEEFTIEFIPPTMDTPIKCLCQVRWRREYTPKSSYEPGMGIKFLDLGDEIREVIDAWVKSMSGT
jgi:hypothetical protein